MRNKIVAGLFGIFLGGFGIHKFYLGKIVQGIFYILFSWTLIPSFIGFIEGIVYLAMSEASFNQKYNPEMFMKMTARTALTQLSELKDLMDRGIITPSEYEERRERLVQQI